MVIALSIEIKGAYVGLRNEMEIRFYISHVFRKNGVDAKKNKGYLI